MTTGRGGRGPRSPSSLRHAKVACRRAGTARATKRGRPWSVSERGEAAGADRLAVAVDQCAVLARPHLVGAAGQGDLQGVEAHVGAGTDTEDDHVGDHGAGG